MAFNSLENWNFPVLGCSFLIELLSYINQAARRKEQTLLDKIGRAIDRKLVH